MTELTSHYERAIKIVCFAIYWPQTFNSGHQQCLIFLVFAKFISFLSINIASRNKYRSVCCHRSQSLILNLSSCYRLSMSKPPDYHFISLTIRGGDKIFHFNAKQSSLLSFHIYWWQLQAINENELNFISFSSPLPPTKWHWGDISLR